MSERVKPLWKGRPCPKCGRRGLHQSAHPHCVGYRDWNHVSCRFCQEKFNEGKLELMFEKEDRDGVQGS